MANHQDHAGINLAMMANHNNQDIDINNDQAAKKRKREKNLMNWKWSEVIVVDDLPDIVEPANVANVPNTANVPIIQHDISDDEIPMAPIKRNKKSQIKITGRNRFKQLFDEDESEEHDKLPFDDDESEEDEDTEDDDWV